MLTQWLVYRPPMRVRPLAHGGPQLPSSESIHTFLTLCSAPSKVRAYTSKFTKNSLSLTVSEFVPLNNKCIQSPTSVKCILVDNDETISLSGWCGHVLVVKP